MNGPAVDPLDKIIHVDFEKRALITFLSLLNDNDIKDRFGNTIKFRFVEYDDSTGCFEAHAFMPEPKLEIAR